MQAAGYTLGTDIVLALDVAATEFYKDGAYTFEGSAKSSDEMIAYYRSLVDAYPIVSIEDPLSEEDWAGWKALTAALGDRIQIVGDDLFVTNPQRIARGIAEGSANAVLVKVNQIGSLTETFDAVELSHRAGLPLHDEPPLRARPRTPPSPTWRSPPAPVRSRPARRPARTGWRSTTSCCASKKSWTTRRVTPAPPPSPGTVALDDL